MYYYSENRRCVLFGMLKYEISGDAKTENLQTKSQLRSNVAQTLAVCITNMLLLNLGLTVNFSTILISSLQQEDEGNFNLILTVISWIGSINLICIPIGCALSGAITEFLGRKKCMQLVNIPSLCAWILLKYTTSIYLIFIALCLTGISRGLLEAPVITYVAEICQPRLRGVLSSTSKLSAMGGVLIQFLLGTFFHWRTVALVNFIFPIASFILLFFVPESPHWLILQNRLLDARKSIAWLRGWTNLEEIEPEFKHLCKYIANHENPGNNTQDTDKMNPLTIVDKIKLYTKKNFLWPYAVVSFCFFLYHFTGMTTIRSFTVQIFASLQVPINNNVATVYLVIAEVIGCVVCMFTIRKFGKRTLYFFSLIGLGVCLVLIATYAYFTPVKELANLSHQNHAIPLDNDKSNAASRYTWVPLFLIIVSAFISYVGLCILPWILTGELYSNETRAAATGLSVAIGYIFGFLSNKIFLSLIDLLPLSGMFLFYSAASFIGCALLYVILPETEGKPLHEITDHFKGIKRLSNSVRKKDKGVQNEKVNEGY